MKCEYDSVILNWAEAIIGQLCNMDGNCENIARVISKVVDLSEIPQCIKDIVSFLSGDCCNCCNSSQV